MTEPTVTIVISIYRRSDYLRQALASALAQTFTDFEILVSDDGPSQQIADTTAAFADSRIRYRHNGRNLGIALNHYASYHEARGRYIANLNDDDLWEPTFLATLVPALESDPTVNVAFCDHHLIDAEGRFLRQLVETNSRTFGRDILAPGRHQPFFKEATERNTIPMAMAAVFRKSILHAGDYPARLGGCYDHWLSYLATKDGGAVFYVPERLTRYRVHSGSASAIRGILNLRNGIYVRSRFLKDARETLRRQSLQNGLGVFYGKLALLLIDQGKLKSAWILEKHAFSLLNRPKNILGLLKNMLVHYLRRVRR